MSIKDIYERAKSSEKTVSGLVTKGEKSSLIAIGLGKGVVLKEHTAPGPTKLIVLQGAIEYSSERGVQNLNTLDEFVIPLEERHSVKGLDHSVFLLSVNK